MKKNSNILIGLIVLIILVIGAILLFHKTNYPVPVNSTAKTSTSQNQPAGVNNAVLKTKTSSNLGEYLTNPSGNTLYTYGGDTSGVSNCTGSCLSAWPAYQQTSSSTSLPANVSTIKRSGNGETQYTYKGFPLYTFASENSGQVTGNGVSNFSVAKP